MPSSHETFVEAWLARVIRPAPPADIARLFEAALNAVWARACVPLGRLTLGAIVQRVLTVSARRHPLVAAIELGNDGMRLDALAAPADRASAEALTAALQFTLLELLRVVCGLTGEVLTPALHEALDAVDARASAPATHSDGRDAGRSDATPPSLAAVPNKGSRS